MIIWNELSNTFFSSVRFYPTTKEQRNSFLGKHFFIDTATQNQATCGNIRLSSSSSLWSLLVKNFFVDSVQKLFTIVTNVRVVAGDGGNDVFVRKRAFHQWARNTSWVFSGYFFDFLPQESSESVGGD
jgi:hypothetical protein